MTFLYRLAITLLLGAAGAFAVTPSLPQVTPVAGQTFNLTAIDVSVAN